MPHGTRLGLFSPWENPLSKTSVETILYDYSPVWRNWQTRRTQNPLPARACGFDPLHRQMPSKAKGKRSALRCLLRNIKNRKSQGG